MALFNPARPSHSVKKGPWSEIEDKRLLDLVTYFGAESWMDISKEHGSRNAKQCRERYHQNLKSSINRGPITPEEGVTIERYYAEKGPKWAEIARALGGRSDNQVKNWYNGQKNRRTKMTAHSCQSIPPGTNVQQPLSALRPVDVQLLQQRGHPNPYSQRHHDHQSKPSPTISHISEAPSLISDASSTSSGISPSPNTAYPTQHSLASSILSSWNEITRRPILPPLGNTISPQNIDRPYRISITIPPILPPSSQSEQHTIQQHNIPYPETGPDVHERQQSTQISIPYQLPCHHHLPSPPASSSSLGSNKANEFPSQPSELSLSRIQFPSNEQTASYSLLELSVPSDQSYMLRQPHVHQPRTAPSRKPRTPYRYAPYSSPRALPASPEKDERSAQDRMKLVNILGH